MLPLFRSAVWFCAAIILALGLSAPVNAADRSATLLPSTDLPGFDYSVVKDIDRQRLSSGLYRRQALPGLHLQREGRVVLPQGRCRPRDRRSRARPPASISMAPTAESIAADAPGRTAVPGAGPVDSARYFLASAAQHRRAAAQGLTYADLVAAGDDAVAPGRLRPAPWSPIARRWRSTATIPALWLKLADMAARCGPISRPPASNSGSAMTLPPPPPMPALNAFLHFRERRRSRHGSRPPRPGARAPPDVARVDCHLSRQRSRWSTMPTLQARLDKVVAEHGFRITSNEVDAEAATPRICVVFSDPLPAGDTDLSSYVVVDDAPQVAVETDESQICITGVEHGRATTSELRAGLPSANGETLRDDVELNVYVPDRSPFVGFANNAYVMPAGLGGGLPITSVNAKTGRCRDLPHRRPLDRDGRAQRHLPAHARRLFGRGRRQPLWRKGLGGPGRPRPGRQPNDDDHHGHPGDRCARRHPARRLCHHRQGRPASSRTTGRRWPRSGSSSPISASPRSPARMASMPSCAR